MNSISTNYILILGVCLLIGTLSIVFARFLFGAMLLLVAAFVIGVLILPLDVDLSAKIIGLSVGLFICGAVIHGLALLVFAIVVTPILMILVAWGLIKPQDRESMIKGSATKK